MMLWMTASSHLLCSWLTQTWPQSQRRQDLLRASLPSPRATTLRSLGLAENERAHNYSPTEQTLWHKTTQTSRVFLLLTHWKVCSHLRVTSSETFMSDKSMYDLQRKLLTLLVLLAREWVLPVPSVRSCCVCHAWQQTQPLFAECRRVKVWSGPGR